MSGIGISLAEIYNKRVPPPHYVPGIGRGAKPIVTSAENNGVITEEVIDDDNDIPLFGEETAPLTEEEKAAEEMFDTIDSKLQRRQTKPTTPTTELKFKNIVLDDPNSFGTKMKRILQDVTTDEWESIPEEGVRPQKKKQKKEVFTALSDSFIMNKVAPTKMNTEIDVSGMASTIYDPTNVRQANLAQTLNNSTHSGQTSVDPSGYLTSLNETATVTTYQSSEIKHFRELSMSLVKSNPNIDTSWISYAKFEESVGNLKEARKIIRKGCEHCPKSENAWREFIRLQTPEKKRQVAVDAIRHVPTSVNLWMDTAAIETTPEKKRHVLLKALEYIPNSLTLWQAAIKNEDENAARLLLHRAVENIPTNVDLWLALAKLETYNEAKNVLNKARKAIPTSPIIWFTSAQLEEANGSTNRVDTLIKRCITSMVDNHVVISHKQWIEYAQNMEKAEAYETCRCIVHNTLPIGIENEDRRHTWTADAESCIQSGFTHTARAIYAYSLAIFQEDEELWADAIQLEQNHGTVDNLTMLLNESVKHCPGSLTLWSQTTKFFYREKKDANMARKVLQEALEANQNNDDFKSSDNIWLLAYQIEYETENYDRARDTLKKAREICQTKRVWLKSALLEWELNNYEEEEKILSEAIKKYPTFDKYYMMLGQMKEEIHKDQEAMIAYRTGLQLCQTSTPLWLLYIRIVQRVESSARARSLLEVARKRNPTSTEIWLESIQLERESNNEQMVDKLVTDGLQQLPNDGRLLCEQIRQAPKVKRGTMLSSLIKSHSDDPYLYMLAGCFFWSQKKNDKAKRWFEGAIQYNSDIGDHWAVYYMFMLETDTEENVKQFLTRFDAHVPIHGRVWCSIKKKKENRKKSPREWLEMTMNELKPTVKI